MSPDAALDSIGFAFELINVFSKLFEVFASVLDDTLDSPLKNPGAFFYLFGMFLQTVEW
jgi:hypothetical protein